MRNPLTQYARWADEQTEYKYGEPMLVEMTKQLVLEIIPMTFITLIAIALSLIVLVFAGAILVQVIPWLWDLVWI